MRILISAALIGSFATVALAQTEVRPNSQPNQPGDSPQSSGRTVIPDEKGQRQPQGWTGPLNTRTGGAPPESPQGEVPPGMQSAPEGSDKTIVSPPK